MSLWIEKIFGLPPVEDRKMTQNPIVRYFLPSRFTSRSDDTYILYQCVKICFFVTGILLFLNWLSLVFQLDFNLYFFTIDLPRTNFIEAFAWSFPFYTSAIIVGTIIPFYLLKYFYNINPKKVDVTWWYVQIRQDSKRKRIKVIPWFIWGLCALTLGMFLAAGAPLFPMTYHAFGDLSSSYYYLLLVFALYWIFYSFVPIYIIFSIVTLYRYIGPYTGNLSSSSIRKGEQK